jgi:TatA/E family protein of Tat protein translocase
VFALILDSLGSTELLFILVIALIFFGPRKLPTLARSMGKSLAEFRKASEDFKRTWEREVDLESVRTEDNFIHPESMQLDRDAHNLEEPLIQRVSPELVMPRQDPNRLPTEASSTSTETGNEATSAEPLRKRDWL